MRDIRDFSTYLFDLDGTLLDTRELIYQSFAAMLKAMGRPAPDRDLVNSMIGLVLQPQLERLLGDIPPDEFTRARDIYRHHQNKLSTAYLKPFPGVVDGLRTLRERDKRMAVVSSRTKWSIELYLEMTGLAEYFPVVISPSETERHKPHPDPAIAALAALGARAEDAVFIGDADFDMGCARAAGVYGVLVSWGGMDPATFQHPPDWIIHDFAELLG